MGTPSAVHVSNYAAQGLQLAAHRLVGGVRCVHGRCILLHRGCIWLHMGGISVHMGPPYDPHGCNYAAQGLQLAAQGLNLAAQGLHLAAQGQCSAAQGWYIVYMGQMLHLAGYWLAGWAIRFLRPYVWRVNARVWARPGNNQIATKAIDHRPKYQDTRDSMDMSLQTRDIMDM